MGWLDKSGMCRAAEKGRQSPQAWAEAAVPRWNFFFFRDTSVLFFRPLNCMNQAHLQDLP